MGKPIDTLSKISGISKENLQKIWESVKANRALLDSCSIHDFSKEIKPNNGSSRWQCVNCLGIVSGDHKQWYELGIEHALEKYKGERISGR